MKEDAIPLFLSFCIEQYKAAKGLTGEKSIDIYHSQTYRLLEDESTKLWHYGPVALLECLEEERATGKVTW